MTYIHPLLSIIGRYYLFYINLLSFGNILVICNLPCIDLFIKSNRFVLLIYNILTSQSFILMCKVLPVSFRFCSLSIFLKYDVFNMHFYYLIYILICIIMKYQCFIMVKEVQNVYIYIYIYV